MKHPLGAPLKSRLLALLKNKRLGWKNLPRANVLKSKSFIILALTILRVRKL
jgi:hypothetical protein